VSGNKANPDVVDQSGRSALHLAADQGHLELMQVLLDHDASVDAEDGMGRRTPLYLAATKKDSEAVKLLLGHGASTLNTCFGKTIQEVIEEQMPYFDVSKVQVIHCSSTQLDCA
jgi:ankyrin repeat protein